MRRAIITAILVILFNPITAYAYQTETDVQGISQEDQRIERAKRELRAARERAREQAQAEAQAEAEPYVPRSYPTSSISGCLSASEIASLARGAGFPEELISTMVAIAYRESHYCPSAINSSSGACGIWQMYPCPGPEALDPATNAAMAYQKYVGAGYSLSPWGY